MRPVRQENPETHTRDGKHQRNIPVNGVGFLLMLTVVSPAACTSMTKSPFTPYR